MSIKLLPDDTVRSLGAQVTIHNSSALVKELVDNAIDAKATSISVSISKNTVDKIEVRDNGHGIRPDDFASLGRHGHTSKLRTFEELHRLGGTTLGFRGEALAAANDLGTVTVTTRTSQETVGSVVQLQARVGGVEKVEHKGVNVGTTITVTDFMSTFLPRRAKVIKEAAKEIAKIKDNLIAHTLARPHIQFKLNVLQSQISFAYQPQPGWDAKGAACYIFRDLSFQCLSKSISKDITASSIATAMQGLGAATPSIGHFEIQACIPKPDADPAKIYNKGTFISIDSRPVSATQGTPKKLVTIFRRYLYGSVPAVNPNKSGKPFLQMNIKCPPASYDPNIESAKDDVLFSDETLVLELFETLCREVYGIPDRNAQPSRATEPPQLSALEQELLHDEVVHNSQVVVDDGASPNINPEVDRSRQKRVPRRARMSDADAARGFTVSMDAPVGMFSSEEEESESSDEEEDDAVHATHEEPEVAHRAPASDINPWTIARMAPQRQAPVEPALRDVSLQAIPWPLVPSAEDDDDEDPPILYPYGMSPRGADPSPPDQGRGQVYQHEMSPRGIGSSPPSQGRGRGGGRPQLRVPGGAYRNPRTAAAQLTSTLLDRPIDRSEHRNRGNRDIFAQQQQTPPSSSSRGLSQRGRRVNRGGQHGQHLQRSQDEDDFEPPRHEPLRQTTLHIGGRPRVAHAGMMGSDDEEPDATRVSLQPRRSAPPSSPRKQIDIRSFTNGARGRSLRDILAGRPQLSPTANSSSPPQAQLNLTPLGRQVTVKHPGASHLLEDRTMSPYYSAPRQRSVSRPRSLSRRRSISRRRSMSRALSASGELIFDRSPVHEQTQSLVQQIRVDIDSLADSMWIMLPFDNYLQDGTLGDGVAALGIEQLLLIERNVKHVLISNCAPEIADEVKEAVDGMNLVGRMKGKGKAVVDGVECVG